MTIHSHILGFPVSALTANWNVRWKAIDMARRPRAGKHQQAGATWVQVDEPILGMDLLIRCKYCPDIAIKQGMQTSCQINR